MLQEHILIDLLYNEQLNLIYNPPLYTTQNKDILFKSKSNIYHGLKQVILIVASISLVRVCLAWKTRVSILS